MATQVNTVQELLSLLKTHVGRTGHREFYTIRWNLDLQVGFGCRLCDREEEASFEVGIDSRIIMMSDEAHLFLGPGAHARLLEILDSMVEPEPPRQKTDWEWLLVDVPQSIP